MSTGQGGLSTSSRTQHMCLQEAWVPWCHYARSEVNPSLILLSFIYKDIHIPFDVSLLSIIHSICSMSLVIGISCSCTFISTIKQSFNPLYHSLRLSYSCTFISTAKYHLIHSTFMSFIGIIIFFWIN